jgi:carboxyl-terminal processing protease
MKKLLEFMKRNYLTIMAVGLISAVLWSFIPGKKEVNEKDKVLIELLTFVLEKGHYAPATLNDDFSQKVYKVYLETLDPTKRYFLKSDIEQFAKYEKSIDDMIKDKDISFFNLTYKTLLQRTKEAKEISNGLLSKPLNLMDEEEITLDFENTSYANNKKELTELWRKTLEFYINGYIYDKEKLAKEDPKNAKTFADLQAEAVKEIKENTENTFKNLEEFKREDWFSIFINCIVTQYDPHTFYFSPDDKEKYDTAITGKYEGIGARLLKKTEGIEVSELMSGGPAWRGKLLEQGDIILKVGQGNDEPIDITGMKINDVIKKIKGPKGTVVKLTVKRIDGSIKVIPITRDEVETEETFAKSTVVNKDGKLFGVIYLPGFYIDFENRENRNCFKDVAQEIERLKALQVQGIVMDLRNNGGGSLETVVKMTGLFIEKGPIVQVKNATGNITTLPDVDPKVQWTGPLVVMINQNSASASEIFAAAIQDYNRGIVIGSKQSYGKGTVQNVFDLNKFVRTTDQGDLGALKTTTQKFYRINGGSTQLEGVKSDIVLPDRFAFIETGERDEKSALPYDKIPAANYIKFGYDFNDIIAKSKQRIAANENFNLIIEQAKFIESRNKAKTFDIKYADYVKDSEDYEVQTKKFEALKKFNNNLSFSSLPYELEITKTDNLLKEKRDRWHEELTKDIYLTEGLHVLADIANKYQEKPIAKKETKKSKSKKEKLVSMK